jgi:mRNA-degrading endonuclease toxin of MazEF toxin-antitoxin module
MVKLAIGSVAVMAYSSTDRRAVRPRPVVVVAHGEQRDVIVCQITSQPYGSASAIEITDHDFAQGQLPHRGFAHPDKIFSTDLSLIVGHIGALTPQMRQRILTRVRSQFTD